MKKNKNISIRDFKRYFENKMNPQEKTDFENKIAESPFSKEALEGFKEFPGSLSEAKNMNRQIRLKSKANSFSFSHFLYFAIPIIIVTTVFFLLPKSKNNISVMHSKKESILANDTHKLNTLNREIEKAEMLPESKQISSEKIVTEQRKVQAFEKSKPLETLEKIRTISIGTEIGTEKPTAVLNAHYSYLPTTYMYDFKVVNYAKLNRNNVKKIISDEGNLSPRFENYRSKKENASNENVSFESYTDFLNEAMEIFSKNDFKVALRYFNIMLQQYPDDLNAHFYGGLSYYNLGLNQKACEYFDAVLENNSITFTQEALWYKSLSLLNAGEKKEAEEILHKIIDAEGFYANHAKEMLDLINK